MAQSGLRNLVHCIFRDAVKICYTIDKHQHRALSYVPLAAAAPISNNHAAKTFAWNTGQKRCLYSTDAKKPSSPEILSKLFPQTAINVDDETERERKRKEEEEAKENEKAWKRMKLG